MFISRAVSLIKLSHRGALEDVHDEMSTVVKCTRSCTVTLGDHQYSILNCLIRVQVGVLLTGDEKRRLLYDISRRILYASPGMLDTCGSWLGEFINEYRFLVTGYLVREEPSLRLAMTTMQIEASVSHVPTCVPFTKCQALTLHATRWMVLSPMIVPVSRHVVLCTQPMVLRSTLKTVCDPKYWPIVSEGMCYMPAVRASVSSTREEWAIHLHHNYDASSHVQCNANCCHCMTHQPLSLQHTAQVRVIQLLIMEYRERILRDANLHCFF